MFTQQRHTFLRPRQRLRSGIGRLRSVTRLPTLLHGIARVGAAREHTETAQELPQAFRPRPTLWSRLRIRRFYITSSCSELVNESCALIGVSLKDTFALPVHVFGFMPQREFVVDACTNKLSNG